MGDGTKVEFTRRENQIIKLVAEGKSNEEVGINLGISKNTVKMHINHILDKLDLKDRTQLVIYYFKNLDQFRVEKEETKNFPPDAKIQT